MLRHELIQTPESIAIAVLREIDKTRKLSAKAIQEEFGDLVTFQLQKIALKADGDFLHFCKNVIVQKFLVGSAFSETEKVAISNMLEEVSSVEQEQGVNTKYRKDLYFYDSPPNFMKSPIAIGHEEGAMIVEVPHNPKVIESTFDLYRVGQKRYYLIRDIGNHYFSLEKEFRNYLFQFYTQKYFL